MLLPDFSIFPQLKTERLLLRQITLNDTSVAFEIRSNEEVNKYMNRPLATTIEDVLKWINTINENLQKNDGIIWGISWKNEPHHLLGAIGFWRIEKEHYRAEIGYFLHPSWQRKGVVMEALKEILHYGFYVLKLHSVEAHIDPLNISSGKVIEKQGFTREAYFKENNFFRGKFRDTAIYSLLTPVKEPVVSGAFKK